MSFVMVINNVNKKSNGIRSLFMDDLCGAISAAHNVVELMNEEFKDLQCWSAEARQLFHPAKFACINVKGTPDKLSILNPTNVEKRLMKEQDEHMTIKRRSQIKFHETRLSIQEKGPPPMYIGTPFDDRLQFKELIKLRTEKTEQNMWRISTIFTTTNAVILQQKFYAWIFPQFLYAAPIWVPHEKPATGYGMLYDNLNKWYISSAKYVLGVTNNVSHVAVLAVLGWLPLRTVLMLQSIKWIKRMQLIPESEVFQLFEELQCHDEDNLRKWNQTIYYKGELDLIYKLQQTYNIYNDTNEDLMEVDLNRFEKIINEAAVTEFNAYWDRDKTAKYTKKLIRQNKGRNTINNKQLYTSRKLEIAMYKLYFFQNQLNYNKHEIQNRQQEKGYWNPDQEAQDPKCRYCHHYVETVKHVLTQCKMNGRHMIMDQCHRTRKKWKESRSNDPEDNLLFHIYSDSNFKKPLMRFIYHNDLR